MDGFIDENTMMNALAELLGDGVREETIMIERRDLHGRGDGKVARVQVLVGGRDGGDREAAFRRLYGAAEGLVHWESVIPFDDGGEVDAEFRIGQAVELAQWMQGASE